MNIKINQLNIKSVLAVMISTLVSVIAIGSFQIVSAAPTDNAPNELIQYCQKKAPKAKNSCPEAASDARNKASYNCDKAKKVESCVSSKAKAYINKAAKGNPNDAKFKQQLDKVLDDVKGSRNTYNPDAVSESAASNTASVFGTGKTSDNICGNLDDNSKNIATNFDFGCLGPNAPDGTGPIQDLAYSIIRFLSAGVGVVIIASIVLAGIQYSASEGNPDATQAAKDRIRNAVIGLLIYLFTFALIQYLVPGGAFAGSMTMQSTPIINMVEGAYR